MMPHSMHSLTDMLTHSYLSYLSYLQVLLEQKASTSIKSKAGLFPLR